MKATYEDCIKSIEAAEVPEVVDRDLRGKYMKERSAAIRALFKKLGIVGVSVTSPNYSMATATDVLAPRDDHSHSYGVEFADCLVCRRNGKARKMLRAIILAAFPDLDDRSDGRSDHYDFKFSIHGG